MNRKLFYENEEHGEALFIEVLSFIIPMDENTLRGKQENERKQVSKLLIINHDWYDVIKAGYYSRFHIYESIKQHYDDLDFELLIKYCIGEEYTKNVNFSKAKSFKRAQDFNLISVVSTAGAIPGGRCCCCRLPVRSGAIAAVIGPPAAH